ncbi:MULTISPECIES: hypothetical protein [Mediterranea]|uniref:hypothetical protein n=1 Tax=Mediterranea TaxID=1926659 RepID=UPI002012A712|nr:MULTISPECIES: hypothetical protein [Mediterranea]MCL1606674.1 hypothetical protein [Mediterranea sp. ET5]
MKTNVEVIFPLIGHDVEHISFLDRQSLDDTGGNIDAPIGVKGYVRFARIAKDALHKRGCLMVGTSI